MPVVASMALPPAPDAARTQAPMSGVARVGAHAVAAARVWAELIRTTGAGTGTAPVDAVAGATVRVTAQVFVACTIGAAAITAIWAASGMAGAAALAAVSAGVGVMWWATALTRRLPAVLLPAAAGAAMVASAALLAPGLAASEAMIAWLLVAVSSAGFLLAPRRARIVISVSTVTAVALGAALSRSAEDAADVGLQSFDVFTTGMAVTAALAALSSAMAWFDRRDREYQQQVGAASAAADWAADAAGAAVLLHNTAVNTLNMVASGFAPDVAQLREQCGRDVTQISAWTAEPMTDTQVSASFPGALVELIGDRAVTLGLAVDIDVERAQTQQITIDAEVAAAVSQVVTAMLTAAAGRARTEAVKVRIAGSVTGGMLRMTGTDPTADPGIVTSARRAERAGLTVELGASPVAGVRLSWGDMSVSAAPAPLGVPVRLADVLTDVLPVMLARIGVWMMALYAVAVVARGIAEPGVALASATVALGVAIVTCSAALLAARSGIRPTRRAAVLVMLVTPLVTLLPVSGLSGCDRVGPMFWQVDTGVLMVVFVAWLSRSRWVTAGACAGFAVSVALVFAATAMGAQDCGEQGVTSVATAIVVITAAILLRRHLVVTARASAVRERARAQSAAQAQEAANYAFIRRLRSRQALDRAVALLTAIHVGVVDPTSQRIRSAARVEEAYLRAGLAVPADVGPVGEALVELLSRAAHRQLLVRMTVLGSGELDDQVWTQAVTGPASAFIDAAPEGTTVSIRLVRAEITSGSAPAELVVVADREVPGIGVPAEDGGTCRVQVEHAGGQTMMVITPA